MHCRVRALVNQFSQYALSPYSRGLWSVVMRMGADASIISERDALPGRSEPLDGLRNTHVLLNNPIKPPFPDTTESVQLAMGCFWGAERRMWQQPGVYTTAVGYAGGYTENPTYREVCSGKTGHTEVVLVVYDTTKTDLSKLMQTFWESHDPTQGMRQGNDSGSQYRSAVYYNTPEQGDIIKQSRDAYQAELTKNGHGKITTEIKDNVSFFYAEEYHQGYLHKNPGGYCGLKGTGVSCPVGIGKKAAKYAAESN